MSSSRPEPGRLVVGRIVRPHGILGELVVQVLTEIPDRFEPGRALGLGDPDGPTTDVEVVASRPHGARLLVRLAGVEDRNAAESLRGRLLSIPVEEAAKPRPGTWYPHQIEGLAVVDLEGNHLGTIAGVLFGPANDAWVVDTEQGQVLVPAVSAIVRFVDVAAGRVILAPVPGLFEHRSQ